MNLRLRLRRGRTKILMKVSYGDQYVAGHEYLVPQAEADQLILKDYAEGELSKEYTTNEVDSLRGRSQKVSV